MINRIPMPQQSSPEFTPEETEKAKIYTDHLMYEIEMAIIGEIEKIDGKVPLPVEIMQFGRQLLNKDLSMDFTWRGMLLLSVKPNQVNAEGQRGTQLIIHKFPERAKED